MQKENGTGGQTMRDRLVELFSPFADGTYNGSGTIIDGTKVDDVADYLLANGVIVPKFNVGDTVWYITGIHRTIVKSAIVEEIIINRNGVSDLYVKNDMGGYFENSVDIFYKTKEEAEEKLRELIK
jgi:hypothetical protein